MFYVLFVLVQTADSHRLAFVCPPAKHDINIMSQHVYSPLCKHMWSWAQCGYTSLVEEIHRCPNNRCCSQDNSGGRVALVQRIKQFKKLKKTTKNLI